jgi:hypothetical protein
MGFFGQWKDTMVAKPLFHNGKIIIKTLKWQSYDDSLGELAVPRCRVNFNFNYSSHVSTLFPTAANTKKVCCDG